MSVGSAPEVSVVVPAHAAARTIGATLEALRGQTLAADRFEVIVADPGADGTAAVLARAAENWPGGRLRLVHAPLHGGPAVKRNAGAAGASGRLLAFTDADCVPEPGWLAAGLAAFERGHQVVQGRTVAPDGAERPLLYHGVNVERDVGLHETCNMFYERELFERLGGFPEHWFRQFGVPFGEDADFGWRARRGGARFLFEPAAVVRHPLRAVSLRGHLSSCWLARGFPELAREAPELRRTLFYGRVFLSRRSAAFAAAALGAALARRAPPAALLALPYAVRLAAPRDAPRDARGRAAAIATALLTDATLSAALAWGSVRARNPVL